MTKFFDIMPPQPKAIIPQARKNYLGSFLFIVLVIIGITFMAKSAPTSPTKNTVSHPENLASKKSFELFDSQGQSSLTNSSNLKVRIINASDKPEAINLMTELLTKNNYLPEQTSSVAERYDQTTIYYRPNQIKLAQDLKLILDSLYQIKLEESQSLGSTFSLLVIIGQK